MGGYGVRRTTHVPRACQRRLKQHTCHTMRTAVRMHFFRLCIFHVCNVSEAEQRKYRNLLTVVVKACLRGRSAILHPTTPIDVGIGYAIFLIPITFVQ